MYAVLTYRDIVAFSTQESFATFKCPLNCQLKDKGRFARINL
jgi:hypothetical protein